MKISTMLLLLLSAIGAGASIPRFFLHDTKNRVHTPAEWKHRKAVVLFFVTNDCPVGNSYVPEMNRIQDTYGPRGVEFLAVEADASVSAVVAATYAADYRYDFPLLLDPHQTLAQLAGATVTPQAIVLSPEGKVLYRGRIDNRVEDFGKQRPEATVHDLRNSLDAVLAGRAVPAPFTKSIGCAITRAN